MTFDESFVMTGTVSESKRYDCVTCWYTKCCKTAHFALRNGPFQAVKWAESECEMGRFAMAFGKISR